MFYFTYHDIKHTEPTDLVIYVEEGAYLYFDWGIDGYPALLPSVDDTDTKNPTLVPAIITRDQFHDYTEVCDPTVANLVHPAAVTSKENYRYDDLNSFVRLCLDTVPEAKVRAAR